MTNKIITQDRKCYMYRVMLKTDPTKDYVGVSIHPEQRWWQHRNDTKKGSQYRFHKALRKYGADAFDWKIIAIYRNEDIARDMEEVAVLFCGMGYYNETLRMNGKNGPVVFTDELRKKISVNTKAAMARPEVKEKLGTGCKAMWADPEKRLQATQRQVDRWQDPEDREIMQSGIKEAMNRLEVLDKIAETKQQPGYWEMFCKSIRDGLATPEAKAKRSKSQIERFKNNPASEETKEKARRSRRLTENRKKVKKGDESVNLIRINLLPR